MNEYTPSRLSAALAGLCLGWIPLRAQPVAGLQTERLLSEAREPVRIVCFGDSITGIYYHSGGRRAWPEMLQIALERIYPEADLKIFNAGVSGNTSAQGLARMQKDVLDRKPHLVVIMFGMNDLAYGAVTPEQDAAKRSAFVENLKTIVGRCRDAGSAWTAVGLDPTLCYPELTPRYREGAVLLREIVQGHDLEWLSTPADAPVTLQAALDQWFDRQTGKDR